MITVKLERGMRVKVQTNFINDGHFYGHVTSIGEFEVHVLPESEDIRTFLGGTGIYKVGKAHLNKKIEVLL